MAIDAKELNRIIKTCARMGVVELKVGDVHIKFGPGEAAQIKQEQKIDFKVPTAAEWKAESERVLLTENVQDVDDRLANLQLEDPTAFEELLIERELESGGSSGNSFN